LRINDSQVVIDGLVEDHVINNRVDLLPDGSDLFDTVDIDIFQQLVDLLMAVNFMDKGS
jgi:hypothetical protein